MSYKLKIKSYQIAMLEQQGCEGTPPRSPFMSSAQKWSK